MLRPGTIIQQPVVLPVLFLKHLGSVLLLITVLVVQDGMVEPAMVREVVMLMIIVYGRGVIVKLVSNLFTVLVAHMVPVHQLIVEVMEGVPLLLAVILVQAKIAIVLVVGLALLVLTVVL